MFGLQRMYRRQLLAVALCLFVIHLCHGWSIDMYDDSACNTEDEGIPVVDTITGPDDDDSGCIQYDFQEYGGIPRDFDADAGVYVDVFQAGGDPADGCTQDPSFTITINDEGVCKDFSGMGFYESTDNH